jgi:hypothetical protein
MSRKFKFPYKQTRITGTLNVDQHTFLIKSRSVLLRMRNVSDKRSREYQNTYSAFNNFFPENRAVYEVKVKQSRYRPGVAQRVPGS